MLISLAARGRGGPRDSLGMIVHRDLEIDIYKIAVQAGVLNVRCCRNEFDLGTQTLLTEDPNDDVSFDKSVSLRSAVTAQSA